MKQYSADLRERLLGAIDAGLPQAEAARLFGVGRQHDQAVAPAAPQTGSGGRLAATRTVAADRTGGRAGAGGPGSRRPRCHAGRALCAWAAATGVAVSPATMSRALAASRVAAQKKSLIAAERDEAARAAWRDDVATLNARRSCLRRRDQHPHRPDAAPGAGPAGRAGGRSCPAQPRSQRDPAGRPHPGGHRSGRGDPGGRRRGGLRRLRRARPGSRVCARGRSWSWTTSSAHKSERARTAVEAVGARLLFLPAYSPDFNPIELAFAKVKERLRAAAAAHPRGPVRRHRRRHRCRLHHRCPRLLRPLWLPPPGRLICDPL